MTCPGTTPQQLKRGDPIDVKIGGTDTSLVSVTRDGGEISATVDYIGNGKIRVQVSGSQTETGSNIEIKYDGACVVCYELTQ